MTIRATAAVIPPGYALLSLWPRDPYSSSVTRTTPAETAVPEHAKWAHILLFVGIAFALAWLVILPLWLGGGLADPLAPFLLIGMMFTPAIAALVVVLAVARGPSPAQRLGVRPFRPAKRTILLSLLGLAGGILLIVVTVAVVALLGLVKLDLIGFSGYAEQLAAALADAPASPVLPPIGVLVLVQLLALPVGGIVNGLFTIGEELGWRGYLLPALLTRIGRWPALLLSGAIWGLWHSPVILLGYNFGRTDISGVLLMTVAGTLLGILFGWLRLASGNIWPAVFAHGGLNAAGGLLLLVMAAGEQLDLAVVGPLGFVAWGMMGIVIAIGAYSTHARTARSAGPGHRPGLPPHG